MLTFIADHHDIFLIYCILVIIWIVFDSGKWTSEMLVNHGLAEVTECPANITDVGIKTAGRVFRNVKSLTIFNCPHLQSPTAWITPGQFNSSSFGCAHTSFSTI